MVVSNVLKPLALLSILTKSWGKEIAGCLDSIWNNCVPIPNLLRSDM
jgi:hypothetical protein